MSDADRETLTKELHVIINCAGSTEFSTKLDAAVKVNVTGPLLLLKLAEQCAHFTCFCHISTCYAVGDKTGVIKEGIHDSPVNWQMAYDQVSSMNKLDLEHYHLNLLGNFPNTYTFSKRMAEHLL